MREHSTVRFTSLTWLVKILNLRFESDAPGERQKVDGLLAESPLQNTREQALEAQKKFVALIDEALKCQSPEGLVMALNDYVAENSETRPAPVRAHWHCRPMANVAQRDAGQALLAMGSNKWLVESRVLMHGIEGHVWQSVAQCLVNGDFGRLRRCLLAGCGAFFETKDKRRRFCTAKHQRALDRGAAKARVALFRERQKAKTQGLKPPARKSKAVPTIAITEAQKFGQFLTLTKGLAIPDSKYAPFIKRKLPGEWKTVFSWLEDKRPPEAIWDNLPARTKNAFRDELWTA